MAIGILSTGAYVPEHVIDNHSVAQWADTTPEWIDERTGVHTRRYASPETPTSELAHQAVRELLRETPDALDDLAAIVLATSTPDSPQPATAAVLQNKLGLSAVPAFDLNAVCSGFLYALIVGAALAEQDGRRVLVVAADKYSSIMNRRDRKTVSLFGDGAGAVLLGNVPDAFGLNSYKLVTHGEYQDLVRVAAGGTRQPVDASALDNDDHLFRMRGRAVRDYALSTFPEVVGKALADAGIGVFDLDRAVLHQANTRLLETLTHRLGLDPRRVPLTAPELGNTGCASIPITLHRERLLRPIGRGERMLFAAVGGGMTAGAVVLTWH